MTATTHVHATAAGEPRATEGPAGPCTMIIFGASGDLTKRLLMPALYNLACDQLLPKEFAIIGTYDELVSKLKARYQGVVNTLDFGFGVRTPEDHERLAFIVQELKKG